MTGAPPPPDPDTLLEALAGLDPVTLADLIRAYRAATGTPHTEGPLTRAALEDLLLALELAIRHDLDLPVLLRLRADPAVRAFLGAPPGGTA